MNKPTPDDETKKQKSDDPMASLFAEIDALRADYAKATEILNEYERKYPRRKTRKTKIIYCKKG